MRNPPKRVTRAGGCSAEITEVLEQRPDDGDEEHPSQAFDVSHHPFTTRIFPGGVLCGHMSESVEGKDDDRDRNECGELGVFKGDKACFHG